jgi:hypothetical protein
LPSAAMERSVGELDAGVRENYAGVRVSFGVEQS